MRHVSIFRFTVFTKKFRRIIEEETFNFLRKFSQRTGVSKPTAAVPVHHPYTKTDAVSVVGIV